MHISIFGFGSVGKKLASLFAGAGHSVTIATRNEINESLPYQTLPFGEAASQADIIVLAIPYKACKSVLEDIAGLLSGKIVVDSTNPLNDDWSPMALGSDTSASEEIAKQVPTAHVVKAFNTIFADVMDKTGFHGQKITAFVAGDNDSAKTEILNIASAMGYDPLDVGGLKIARYLEAMAHLNIQIAVGQAGGTDAAFIYSRG